MEIIQKLVARGAHQISIGLHVPSFGGHSSKNEKKIQNPVALKF
jgi:hypothetical protein